jgi:hypothetical protein
MKSVTAVENRKGQHWGLSLRLLTLAAGMVLASLWVGGCSQPGETPAEVARRHNRVLRLDTEMMLSDIDRALLLDRPSSLTDKRIP